MVQYPINAMFETQRAAIRQGQQALEGGVRLQRNASRVAMTGLKSQESIQRQGLEFAQSATENTMSALETTDGQRREVEDGHRAVAEQFDQLKETHAEFYDALGQTLQQGIDSFDDLSEEYLDAMDEQVDAFLDVQEDIQNEVASDYEEFLSEFDDQLESQFDRAESYQERFEDQLEQQTEQTRQLLERQTEQIEQLQQRLEEQANQRAQQVARATPTTAGSQSTARSGSAQAEDSLESIEGLGSTYADRLRDAGIQTKRDLAGSSASQIAEAADVTEERAQEWIDSA